ncbi:MAG: hypothetical protein AB2L24_03815 [Mangrovibacterium sp.]
MLTAIPVPVKLIRKERTVKSIYPQCYTDRFQADQYERKIGTIRLLVASYFPVPTRSCRRPTLYRG